MLATRITREPNKIQGTEIEKRVKLHKCEEYKIGVSENVDFVLAFYMVHEVPDQKKFFEEIKSILKPNGKALIVEPKLFHVSKRAFKESMMTAKEIGLEPVETQVSHPKIKIAIV